MNVSKTTEAEFEQAVESLAEAYRDATSEEEKARDVDAFDRLYSVVKKALTQYGTFSDGGLEDADFTSSRYVDPSNVVTVSSSVLVTKPIMSDVLTALQSLDAKNVVVLDCGESQVAVFSDGRVLVAE